MRRFRIIGVVVATFAICAGSPAQAGVVETQEYVGNGTLGLSCTPGGDAPNLGGACFSLSGEETVVRLSIVDDLFALPAANYSIYRTTGSLEAGPVGVVDSVELASGSFCGNSPAIVIPAGATDLTVSLSTAGDDIAVSVDGQDLVTIDDGTDCVETAITSHGFITADLS